MATAALCLGKGSSGRWHVWVVGALLVLALLLRVGFLDKSFGRDEIETLVAVQQPISGLFEQLLTSDSHPPLVYLLLHVWLSAGGGSAWIRLFFVSFGLGLCLLAYVLGRQVGGPKTGLVSLVLVVASPGLVWASQYVRPYGPTYFFLVSALICAFKLSDGASEWRWWALYVLACLAGLYSFYMSVLVVASMSFALLASRGVWPHRRGRWLAAHLALALAYLPGVWFFAHQASRIGANEWVVARRGLWLGPFHLGGIVRGAAGVFGLDPFILYRQGISQSTSPWVLYLVAVLGILGLMGCGWVVLRRNEIEASYRWFLGVVVLGPFLLAVALHASWQVALSSRYFLAQSVPLTILVSGFLVTWRPRVYGALGALLFAVALSRAWAVTSRPHEEWKEAVAFVERFQQAGDVLVFPRTGIEPYRFYASSPLETVELDYLFPPDERRVRPQNMDRLLCKMVYPHKRVWVADDQYYADAPWFRAVSGWLTGRSYKLMEGKSFTGVTISLYMDGQGGTDAAGNLRLKKDFRACP